MTTRLRDREQDGRLLLDGGMGQELSVRGIDTATGLWSAQALLDSPDTVAAVHRDFIAAGADVITTNTYAATRRRLEQRDAGDLFPRLNQIAGELAARARDEADCRVLVAGSLPPLYGSYRPDDVRSVRELEPQYREQAEVLTEYVDLFLCETMSAASEAVAAARGAAASSLPVWVSWTVADDGSGRLRSGESIGDAVGALDGEDVAAVRLNGSMPESIEAALPYLWACTGRPSGADANTRCPARPPGRRAGRRQIRARPRSAASAAPSSRRRAPRTASPSPPRCASTAPSSIWPRATETTAPSARSWARPSSRFATAASRSPRTASTRPRCRARAPQWQNPRATTACFSGTSRSGPRSASAASASSSATARSASMTSNGTRPTFSREPRHASGSEASKQLARRAFGYHSPPPLIAMLFLCCGGITLDPPLPAPTET